MLFFLTIEAQTTAATTILTNDSSINSDTQAQYLTIVDNEVCVLVGNNFRVCSSTRCPDRNGATFVRTQCGPDYRKVRDRYKIMRN